MDLSPVWLRACSATLLHIEGGVSVSPDGTPIYALGNNPILESRIKPVSLPDPVEKPNLEQIPYYEWKTRVTTATRTVSDEIFYKEIYRQDVLEASKYTYSDEDYKIMLRNVFFMVTSQKRARDPRFTIFTYKYIYEYMDLVGHFALGHDFALSLIETGAKFMAEKDCSDVIKSFGLDCAIKRFTNRYIKQTFEMTCYFCNRPGHSSPNCFRNPNSPKYKGWAQYTKKSL